MKRGTKENPRCRICGKHGHYSSSCPALAQTLLKAVRRNANTLQISKFLETNERAQTSNMLEKPRKTLKRRSRGKAWHKNSQSQISKHVRKKPAKRKNAVSDSNRKPKPTKDPAKMSVTKKNTEAAFRKLKQKGWLWKQNECMACAGDLVRMTWNTCQLRGHGRLFYRCSQCQAYFDVLTFSHLPTVRLPVAVVAEAVEKHFAVSPPPSASQIGILLGCSATPAGQYWEQELEKIANMCSVIGLFDIHLKYIASDIHPKYLLGKQRFRTYAMCVKCNLGKKAPWHAFIQGPKRLWLQVLCSKYYVHSTVPKFVAPKTFSLRAPWEDALLGYDYFWFGKGF